jgi:uncharacterized protein (DUF58 family)
VDNYRKYFDPEILARLEGLRLRARRIVEGYVSGLHRSPYHGHSIEFAQHRQYAPGDDLRYVDWKVYGRTDKYYLKQFEEETNLICHLLLDTSQSMLYRSEEAAESKLDYARRAAALLAYLVLQQQDSVGLVTFDQEIRAMVRPSASPSHLQEVAHVLDRSSAAEKTSIGPVFHELAERFTKRGIVLILSDLFDSVDGMMAGLKHFRHRRHDVVLMHVLDPAELDFPFRRATLFRGLEGLPEVLVEPRSLRQAYLEEFGRFQRELKRQCRMHQIDYVLLRTDQPLDVALSGFLASRA